MSNEQGFRGVPGVPHGWALVHCLRIGEPGEIGLNQLGEPFAIGPSRTIRKVPIIRKIEKPAEYRPFANGEEFKPHRDRWWSWKDDRSNTFPPAAFGKSGHHSHSWEASFDRKVFDDGTPFGVKVEE